MVMDELDRMGESYHAVFLEAMDPFSCGMEGETIWACGIRQNGHNFEALAALALQNRVINPPEGIVTCASKVQTSALLIKNDVPTPETFFTESRHLAGEFIRKHGKVVSKPVYGFDGVGIHLVETEDQLGDAPYFYGDCRFRIYRK